MVPWYPTFICTCLDVLFTFIQLQLQTLADMFVLVCSVRWSLSLFLLREVLWPRPSVFGKGKNKSVSAYCRGLYLRRPPCIDMQVGAIPQRWDIWLKENFSKARHGLDCLTIWPQDQPNIWLINHMNWRNKLKNVRRQLFKGYKYLEEFH